MLHFHRRQRPMGCCHNFQMVKPPAWWKGIGHLRVAASTASIAVIVSHSSRSRLPSRQQKRFHRCCYLTRDKFSQLHFLQHTSSSSSHKWPHPHWMFSHHLFAFSHLVVPAFSLQAVMQVFWLLDVWNLPLILTVLLRGCDHRCCLFTNTLCRSGSIWSVFDLSGC